MERMVLSPLLATYRLTNSMASSSLIPLSSRMACARFLSRLALRLSARAARFSRAMSRMSSVSGPLLRSRLTSSSSPVARPSVKPASL